MQQYMGNHPEQNPLACRWALNVCVRGGPVGTGASLGDDMQNPPLFHVLLDHLEATDTRPMDVQRFVDRWHRLKTHEAFPCPVCFLAGKERSLAALPAQGDVEPMKCPSCKTQFNVSIDE
ncbi:hypothetical protein ACAX43_27135 [Paraburkholderia sp. IW21]|uniref:hypothetical protein n=1 Tax=Paraburkholderia sp. IW21 TaxID=3242488 RepID=UPI0035227398